MLTEVQAGPYTIRGVSIGGICTSLQVPELGVVFDVGTAVRRFSSTDHWLLSHGHGDHMGGLAPLVGIRELIHRKKPPRVYVPEEIAGDVEAVIAAARRLQRHDLTLELVPVEPGDELALRSDLSLRVLRTHHPVPSVGYQLFDRVEKLRDEFKGLPGAEIGRRRKAGEDLFDVHERLELAYATDTLLRVIETSPAILKSRVLILECTFLDGRKRLEDSRAGCHVHLDELLEVADRFENEHLVLMHFSLLYSPSEVHAILEARLPPELWRRTIVFAPATGPWRD